MAMACPALARFPVSRRKRCLTPFSLRAVPVELGGFGVAVEGQSALVADGVGALEDPVLPGGEAAENFRLERFGAGEAQRRFHAGERVGREARALLEGEANLVVPVDLVD